MESDIDILKERVSRHMERLPQDLLSFRDSPYSGSIHSGVWVGKQKIILGYTSILPHNDPKEETIDITLRAEYHETLEVSADICWSDGEIVKVIETETFPIGSLDKALISLNLYWKRVVPTKIGEVNQLIDSKLPPRYQDRA